MPSYIWMPHIFGCPHMFRSTNKQVKILDKILSHCCGNSFSFKWFGRGQGIQGGMSKGEHWIMVYEYRYEYGYEKERIRGLNHRHKVRFGTLLLPVLVAWKTLNTRDSTAFRRHIEILKSCNSYHSTFFAKAMYQPT